MMGYDVKAKLLEMRTYRPGLIQTTEQLHFSYIAILEGANTVAPSAYSNAYYSMGKYFSSSLRISENLIRISENLIRISEICLYFYMV